MGNAFRIFLVAVIVWYVIRYLIPALFGSSQKQNKSANSPGNTQFRKSTKQGDVTITDYGQPSKKVNPDDEDYVDYEEVE